MKSNFALLHRRRREQLPDSREKLGDRLVVAVQTALELRKLSSELGIRGDDLAQPNERPNNSYAGINRDCAVEDARQHYRTVFGERPRPISSTTFL